MKRFAFKLALFLLPIVGAIGFMLSVAYRVGEAIPLGVVVEMQRSQTQQVVFNPNDRQDMIDLKLMSAVTREAPVLVIGSSRMMHFRSSLASSPGALYNAGWFGASVGESNLFVQALIESGYVPDVLILGLELDEFKDGPGVASYVPTGPHWPTLLDDLMHIQVGTQRVVQDWIRSNLTLWDYSATVPRTNPRLIGFTAIRNGNGIQNDGSIAWVIPLNREQIADAFASGLEDYELRRRQFGIGTTVAPSRLAMLDSLLEMARSAHITVIGVLPPWHPDIYARIVRNSDFTYFNLARQAIAEDFARYGFALHDYSDPATLGGHPEEFSDTFHPEERMSLRMYIDLLRHHPDILGKYSDLATLENTLAAATDPIVVYPWPQ